MANWRNFVTTVGNETPYGLVYKLLRVRVTTERALTNIRTAPHSYTSSWANISKVLLDTLVPDAGNPPGYSIVEDLARLPFDATL